MKIADFAEQRNVDRNAISQYIRRHPEIFEGHTEVVGKNLCVDEEALKELEDKYPLPQVVQVIEDTESRKKLIEAQQLIIQMKDQMLNMQKLVAQAEAKELLLEDRERQLKEKEQQLKQAQTREQDLQQEISEFKSKVSTLQSRNLWERITRKGE